MKNDLMLRALKGEAVQRPPVWMMRQAGRYLPEFMELKNKYDFFTRCQTPELAAEITLQPIRRFPLDASIIFSDILVIPQAMGMDFEMKVGVGPYLENPIRSHKQVEELVHPDINESLGYVMEALRLVKKELNDRIPLIGFAGSPWTLLCYAVQGQGSKTFDVAKKFCFQKPESAHLLLQKITDLSIEYLKEKVKNGADIIQLFDSWGGLLSPEDYKVFSWPYLNQIIDALAPHAPVTVFAKGCWYALDYMAASKASCLGIDWTLKPELAREWTNNEITLQGNFDPSKLFAPPKVIHESVHRMIDAFGTDRYIANLGHGILPNVPVENAEAFINAVVSYKS